MSVSAPPPSLPVSYLPGRVVLRAYDDEDVLEVRAYGAGRERFRAGLLENDRHDVVSDVTLPQQL